MSGTINFIKQSFPGAPTFTDKETTDLENKVVIVTGSNTGLGKQLAKMLYCKNAKVYILSRSESKSKKAIAEIKASAPDSLGELVFIQLDLADLASIKRAAKEFHSKEQRLDILFNNAGVGYPGKGAETIQGHELQLGVNCLGTFALTECLKHTLVSTANVSPRGTVRVVWVSSSAAEATSPRNFLESLSRIHDRTAFDQYCISKLGVYFYATEFAARHRADGIVSIPLNPGNLDSDFWRSQSMWVAWILRKTLLYPPSFGAYTCLFAGMSPEVTIEKSGEFVIPWGRFGTISSDMINASKSTADGGTGVARDFWKWSQDQVDSFV